MLKGQVPAAHTPEGVHRGCGWQQKAEQRCGDGVARDCGFPPLVEVQDADLVLLSQLLHRNPAHPHSCRAGHCCEEQRLRRLARALAHAVEQCFTPEVSIVAL